MLRIMNRKSKIIFRRIWKASNQLKDFKIVNVDPSESLKADIDSVQQEINGIPVFNRSVTLLIKDGRINHVTDGFEYKIILEI